MPTISEIPDASVLHTQLDAVNRAIDALNTGSTVTNMTISASISTPPAPPPPSADALATEGTPFAATYSSPVMIVLDPPISDPATIATLTLALQDRATEITAQLVSQGYTNA